MKKSAKINVHLKTSLLTAILLSALLAHSSCTGFISEIRLQESWNIVDSGKIILHYRPGGFSSAPSPTTQQANSILRNQNFYYHAIQDSICRDYNERIMIYLFNRDEALELIGTQNGGHALPSYRTIYYTFITGIPDYKDPYGIAKPFIGAHELVHVISHRSIGYPGSKVMSEGYAVWLDGTYARKNTVEIIKNYLDYQPEKILTPDQLICDKSTEESVYYPNCGIFVSFLVRQYGVEKINTLFPVPVKMLKKEFRTVTGESWAAMCEKYRKYLLQIQ